MPRNALFDLAVNRAASYLARLGLLGGAKTRAERRQGLEAWYLKTRFVYRIPLEAILDRLEGYPGPDHYWTGGEAGGWQEGKTPNP